MESLSLSYILLVFFYITLVKILPQRLFIILTLIFSLMVYSLIDLNNIFILTSVILINYAGTYLLAKKLPENRSFLSLMIVINLSILVLIKNYINADVSFINNGAHSSRILFGMGCSFYILQCIGHLIDVYYDKDEFQHSLIKYSLYVSFFPQMILGPIERAYYLFDQFDHQKFPNLEEFKAGFSRTVFGLIKKVIVANTLLTILMPFVEAHSSQNSLLLFFLLPFFMVFLYFDFSGNIDFSLGVARMVGIKLNENFDNPLLSRGYIEFFNRWNISFTNWLKDYVLPSLIKLFGNKQFIIFITIGLLSGLWHQTTINFTIWGMIIGLLLVLDHYFIKNLQSDLLKRILSILLGGFTVPFFVFSDFNDSLALYKSLCSNIMILPKMEGHLSISHGISFIFLVLVFLVEYRGKRDLNEFLPKSKVFKNITLLIVFVLIMVFLTDDGQINAYNRF